MSPEDSATIFCYGICLLVIVIVLVGLYLESRSINKKKASPPQPGADEGENWP